MLILTPAAIENRATRNFPDSFSCLIAHLNTELIYEMVSINGHTHHIKSEECLENIANIRFHC
jgi:hypothetical protein